MKLFPSLKTKPRGRFPEASRAATRRTWIFWRELARLRLRGNVQRRVWIDDAGAGARRFRFAAVFVSVQGALVMYPIYSYGSDAQKTSGCRFCSGQSDRLLWFDGAAIRIESRRDADARGEEGQQICLEWREMWITSGSIADVAVVWAKAEDDKVRGFSC